MFKLFIIFYIAGSPVAQIKTDLTFETHQACMEHAMNKWDGHSVDPRFELFPECRIEI
jgi:hypothetical protein